MALTKEYIKSVKEHIETLRDFQESLMDAGHTFWFCDAMDDEHKKPFYYFQINRTRNMATCSTCYKLIENRKKIRRLQKMIGEKQDPLHTNFKELEHVKRISISSKGSVTHTYL
ncbi:MAG: hypothetical protein PF444_07835 [Bacteroidales bacterium]|jgi:hypothetical protein|nr:hypothetical protein [Bacteroidales bacterium]